MNLFNEMTVIDACTKASPYTFTASIPNSEAVPVKMVMPLGGVKSGLYRSPKVGEKVLVAAVETTGTGDNSSSTTYYLMGYLPNAENQSFFEASTTADAGDAHDVITEGGEVFRYKQTGKKAGKEGKNPYSEIGFYQEKTDWKAAEAETADYQDFNGDYPKIDRIKIRSTGDIHESAVNHHQIQAKRFELFVDCDAPAKPGDYESNSLFGDRTGDDSTLYAGDAHIRAKNRIVIKAGESIELQAGRSSILINDEGITIASRKTQSNLYNGWDSLLALKANRGITMFGQHVDIRGGVDFSLAEGYGGAIRSKLGVMRMTSFDLRMLNINTYNYLTMGIGNGLDFLANCGTMSAGSAGANSGMGKSLGLVSVGERAAAPFLASMGNSAETRGAEDIPTALLGTVDLVLSILMAVEMVLGTTIPKKLLRDNHGRDGLYTALACVEYGILLGAFTQLCTPRLANIFESLIEMWGGYVKLGGYELEEMFNTEKCVNSALAGISNTKFKDAYKNGFKDFFAGLKDKLKENATLIKIAVGLGVPVLAGGLGYGFFETAAQNKEFEEELRSL
ncbi:MAG: hypothetical protein LBF83_05360 [Spirochaetaceae bacterium]|jgi:hypothetical protein|nr:hypothetical protein [Spirochaetaceae bacterium]